MTRKRKIDDAELEEIAGGRLEFTPVKKLSVEVDTANQKPGGRPIGGGGGIGGHPELEDDNPGSGGGGNVNPLENNP